MERGSSKKIKACSVFEWMKEKRLRGFDDCGERGREEASVWRGSRDVSKSTLTNVILRKSVRLLKKHVLRRAVVSLNVPKSQARVKGGLW